MRWLDPERRIYPFTYPVSLALLLPRPQHKGLALSLQSLERLSKLPSPSTGKTAIAECVALVEGTEAYPSRVPAELWPELARQPATCSRLKVPEKGSREATRVTAGKAEASLPCPWQKHERLLEATLFGSDIWKPLIFKTEGEWPVSESIHGYPEPAVQNAFLFIKGAFLGGFSRPPLPSSPLFQISVCACACACA